MSSGDIDWGATGSMIGGIGAWAQLAAAAAGILVAYHMGRETTRAVTASARAEHVRLLAGVRTICASAATQHRLAADALSDRDVTAADFAERGALPRWGAIVAALGTIPLNAVGDLQVIEGVLNIKADTEDTHARLVALSKHATDLDVAVRVDFLTSRNVEVQNTMDSLRHWIELASKAA